MLGRDLYPQLEVLDIVDFLDLLEALHIQSFDTWRKHFSKNKYIYYYLKLSKINSHDVLQCFRYHVRDTPLDMNSGINVTQCIELGKDYRGNCTFACRLMKGATKALRSGVLEEVNY